MEYNSAQTPVDPLVGKALTKGAQRLAYLMVHRGAPYLEDLMNKRGEPWSGHEQKYSQPRFESEEVEPESVLFFLDIMSDVLNEIDREFDILDVADPSFTYLDIGCASGGFSKYLLSTSLEARGAGVTLPTKEGGHVWMLPSELKDRFELVWHNLLAYDLGPPNSRVPQPHPSFPFFGREFDLVLLDGHHLHAQVQNEYTRLEVDHARLLLGQLQIALRCVKDGGTIVMKLTKAESEETARVLYILDRVAEEVHTYKPIAIHMTRNSYYVVAKGVRRDELLDGYVAALQSLWFNLTYGGDDEKGSNMPRYLCLEDVIPWETLISEPTLARLIELGTDIWKTQLDALKNQNPKYNYTLRPGGPPVRRGRGNRKRSNNA